MKKIDGKKQLISIIGAISIAIALVLTAYISGTRNIEQVEEAPPAISFNRNLFQGFLEKSNYIQFEESDMQANANRGSATVRPSGVSYLYSEERISLEEVVKSINTNTSNFCWLVVYDDERPDGTKGFITYPKGPASGHYVPAKEELASIYVEPGQGFNIICSQEYSTFDLKMGSEVPSASYANLNELDEGWHLRAMVNETDFAITQDLCEGRTVSAWVQDGANSFIKATESDLNLATGYHLVWFNLIGEAGTCTGSAADDGGVNPETGEPETLPSDVLAAEQALIAAQENLAIAQANFNELEEEFNEAENLFIDGEDLEDQIENKQNRIQELLDEIEEAEEFFNQLENQYNEAQNLQVDLEEAQQAYEQAEEDLVEADTIVDNATSELNVLEAVEEDARIELEQADELEEEICDKVDEWYEHGYEDREEAEDACDFAYDQEQEFREDFELASEARQEYEDNEYENAKESLQEIDSLVSATFQALEEAQNEFEDGIDPYSSLSDVETAVDDAQQEIDLLRQELEDEQQNLQDLQDELEDIFNQFDNNPNDIQEGFDDTEERFEEAEDNLNTAQKAYDTAVAELEGLKSEYGIE